MSNTNDLHVNKLDDIATVAMFMFAGNAILTLKNTKTGLRETYKVQKPKPKKGEAPREGVYFVRAFTGSDNTKDYTYLGRILTRGRDGNPISPLFVNDRSAQFFFDGPVSKGITYVVKHVAAAKELHADLEVWNEGFCGRCGRRLIVEGYADKDGTIVAGIKKGIGPECSKKMGFRTSKRAGAPGAIAKRRVDRDVNRDQVAVEADAGGLQLDLDD